MENHQENCVPNRLRVLAGLVVFTSLALCAYALFTGEHAAPGRLILGISLLTLALALYICGWTLEGLCEETPNPSPPLKAL